MVDHNNIEQMQCEWQSHIVIFVSDIDKIVADGGEQNWEDLVPNYQMGNFR